MAHGASNWRGDRSQVSLLDRPHGGQIGGLYGHAVLLDHRPAVVARERGQDGGEVDRAGAELAEEPLLTRLLDRQLLRPDTVEHARVDVLQVQMSDPIAGLARESGRISAPDDAVARVERDLDEARV